MHRHDPFEKRLPLRPPAFGEVGQLVDFLDPQRREGPRETGCRAGSEHQFERIGDIDAAAHRRAGPEGNRHAVFGVLDHRRAVQPQQFEIAVKVGRGDIEVERMAGRQQRRFHRARSHGREGAFEHAREAEARERRFEPPAANQVRHLAFDLGLRFGGHRIGQIAAGPAEQPGGEGLRPHLRKPPFEARCRVDQFVDIGQFEPQVGQRFERLARMDRLREEHGIDPARARAAHDIGEHAQAQVMFVGDPLEQRAIDRFHAAAGGPLRVEIATGAGQLPQLARHAMHIDGQAHSAVADQRYPQFLLTHCRTS